MNDKVKKEAPAATHVPGSVKLQKRDAEARSLVREKVCATCGRLFQLTPEQKFYDCPKCYQQKHPGRKLFKNQGTQLLVRIDCIECGAQEFINVQPQDPSAALCKACHNRRKRKEKEQMIGSKGKVIEP